MVVVYLGGAGAVAAAGAQRGDEALEVGRQLVLLARPAVPAPVGDAAVELRITLVDAAVLGHARRHLARARARARARVRAFFRVRVSGVRARARARVRVSVRVRVRVTPPRSIACQKCRSPPWPGAAS